MMKFHFKTDSFKKSRGGASRFLSLRCVACGSYLLSYQKDGIGSLKRLYADRIVSPPELVGLQNMPSENIQNLRCRSCETLVGTVMIYEKEKRIAFRIIPGAVKKSILR
jgi:hypothetical protein